MTYDRTTISLHWLTAVSVVVLWVIGQTADWIPDGPINTDVWSVHVVLGFFLLAFVTVRVFWRATGGRRLPPADSGALNVVAKGNHYAMYFVLAVVLALGVTNAFVRGYNLFDHFTLPQTGDRESRHAITHWHGLFANILLALAAIHATAALIHHYGWRDGLLKRMLPRASADAHVGTTGANVRRS
jgi:cytochrome b561